MPLGAREQPLRLGRTPLAPPQFGQLHPAPPRDVRARVGLGARQAQFAFGVAPLAARDQHRGVVSAADLEQGLHVPALAERLHTAAPLDRAVVVAHAIAGVHQKAAGLTDGIERHHVARERRRHRFVEAAHAVGDAAGVDQRERLQRQTHRFEIDEAVRAAERRGLDALTARACAVAVDDPRPVAFPQHRPPVFGRPFLSLEQAAGAVDPAPRDRRRAVIVEGIHHHRQRHPGGRPAIVALLIQLVGALSRRERRGCVIDPPLGPAEAFVPLGRLAAAKRRAEAAPRIVPRTPTKCCLAGAEV